MSRLGMSLAFSVSLSAAIVGCDKGGEEASASASASATGGAPAPPATQRSVKTGDEALIAKGKKAYEANCVACHAETAEGRVGMAPSLASKSFLEAASDAFLISTIATGRAGTTMMGWGTQLKNDEIDGIVAYLRSLTPTEPVKLDEGPVKGKVANGEKLFHDICATCHGKSGAGYQESGSGTGIGRTAFLSTATNGYLRHIIKQGKSGTAMRPFAGAKTSVANLKEDEIEDVIAYLRKNAW